MRFVNTATGDICDYTDKDTDSKRTNVRIKASVFVTRSYGGVYERIRTKGYEGVRIVVRMAVNSGYSGSYLILTS